MNRNDWERQVHESNMNVTARCIALVVGSFGNWTVDKTVEPGATKVAKYAGVTRDTVNEYVSAMVEQGWLKPMGTGQYNTTIYELCEVVADTTGILARTKRKMNPKSTAKLKRGHIGLVVDNTGNYEDSEDNLVADTRGVVADTSGSQLPIPEGLVADSTVTNLSNLDKNNLDKNLVTSPGKPVAVEHSPNLEVKETEEMYLKGLNTLEARNFQETADALNLDAEQRTTVLRLITNKQVRGTIFEEKFDNALFEIGMERW